MLPDSCRGQRPSENHLPVTAILFAIAFLMLAMPAPAQNRGVYPLGMSATNSGVTPEPGVSYANQLLFYSRDQSRVLTARLWRRATTPSFSR